MKTNLRTLACLVAGFATTFAAPTGAQQRVIGLGVGLSHSDRGDEITVIVPESPLQESGLQVGDRIVAVNGKSLLGTPEILVSSLVGGDNAQPIELTIHRAVPDTELTFTVTRGRLRRGRTEPIAMIDPSTVSLRVAAFTEESLDELEATLDSLAKGSNGFTNDIEVNRQRCDEARQSLVREMGPGLRGNFYDKTTAEELKRKIEDYVGNKWGWRMGTLQLDARGARTAPSPEVLRLIRLFCKEHSVSLLRLL